MRTETMLIDLANMSMTRTISSRENDRNGFKIIVNLKERGKPVDLTGYVVKYEAISPYGTFVRDDAVVTNATGGVFEYTVSKEAVSKAGVWISYFAFEKGTERFTTQDIRISLGRDVKQGNIAIEDYIAEFDKLKKQIDTLQVAVDKADVVKKSGDTMTGILNMSNDKSLGFLTTSGVRSFDHYLSSGGTYYMRNVLSNKAIYSINSSGFFDMISDTNLLKKTGDTMSGNLTFNGSYVPETSGSGIIQGGSSTSTRWRIYQAGGGELSFVPSATVGGSDWDWSKAFRIKVDGTIRQTYDTAWANLTLINGATVDAGNTPRYIRKGDVIYIVGAVTNITDSMTIVNLPTGLRPTSNCAFAVAYLSTDSKKYAGEINVRSDGRITLDWMWNNVKSVSFCISYHL